MNELKKLYEKEVSKKLKKELSIDNPYAIPRIEKVVVNMGIGKQANKDKGIIEKASEVLARITGQSPSVRQARVSVASFSLRRGMPVGLMVTLRGERMYAFLERLFKITLPRLRDFRGLSKESFDNHGNYTLGFDEVTVFPEVDINEASNLPGMEITIVTSGSNPEKSEKLLEMLGMPFEKEEE